MIEAPKMDQGSLFRGSCYGFANDGDVAKEVA